MKKDINLQLLLSVSHLLNNKPMQSITITELSTVAGLSRRTFYNYYYSKEDFFTELLSNYFDRITQILQEDMSLGTPVMLKVLKYLFNKENQFILQSLLSNFPGMKESIIQYIRDIVKNSDIVDLSDKLERNYSVPYEYAFELYTTTVNSIILKWITTGFQESPEEISNIISKSVKV
ncbi:TetR family transcriptional regulator [Streptococcus varani]|uniref:TetR family transcriptional regulator n=1 Tax=Streptococcus varani TaxID=1608583 RepID=A0A0E4H3Y4_9STRE|nr:TetR/AcrR family transcriptional regulator [Streptococcus varani]CQR23865.1 TetR family transcriptional regulator [Streptococcus varani]